MHSITSLLSAQSDDFISSCPTRISVFALVIYAAGILEADCASCSPRPRQRIPMMFLLQIQHEDPKR